MAFTQSDVDNLKEAIATGLTQASIQGELVQYRSLAEMKEILRMMSQDISAGSGAVKSSRVAGLGVSYVNPSRGL